MYLSRSLVAHRPACVLLDIISGRHSIVIPVCRVHPPPDIGSVRNGKERKTHIPVTRPESPRYAQQIDRESRAQYLSLIHVSEPTRLLSISYAVFCLKKK